MDTNNNSLYISAAEVMKDWGVSRASAYNLIRDMNNKLLAEHPNALVVPGKVNKFWYFEQCLISKEVSYEG